MNIETGEIRDMKDIPPEERASGKWVRLPGHDRDGHPDAAAMRKVYDRAFNGRHREARIAAFQGRQARKKLTEKSRRKMRKDSQRANR